MRYPVIICITLAAMLAFEGHAATGFRVTPYLQNPQSDAVALATSLFFRLQHTP